jgi:tetratricopeptide (TPR) repeat protein
MQKGIVATVLVLLLLAPAAHSQKIETEPPGITPQLSNPLAVSLALNPGLLIPLDEDGEYYKVGGNISITGTISLPFFPPLFIPVQGGYSIIPVHFDTALSALSIGAGAGIGYNVLPKLRIQGWATGGYFYSFLNDKSGPSGGNPFISAGAGVSFALGRSLGMGFNASYINYLGLYNGLGVSLSTTYHMGRGAQAYPGAGSFTPEALLVDGPLQIHDVAFEDVFPMFFKYYDDHPVGTAVLTNPSRDTIDNLKVTLFIKQYMDNPKQCPSETVIGKQQDLSFDLTALFTERVLEITETTKVSAEITFEYTVGGDKYRESHIETVRILDRNAITWDDDRKAAVFVTTKDPTVLTFSKNIASLIEGSGSKAINHNLRMAMAFYQALSLYGLSYIIDPTTPYKDYSKNKTAVDFLQFPRQTFQYKAGDCDDLTILYSSLLESIGIETAFITIPGHIFMAFSLDLTPEEARKAFYRDDDLIYMDGSSWIPVEITELKGGFLNAWQTGAREWREATSKEQEGFFPTHAAWKVYEPVGLPDEGVNIVLPSSDRIINSYLQELLNFVDREIYPQVREVEDQIKRYGSSPRMLNKLGVLYARYGKNEEAEEQFEKALAKDRYYVPALVNLGNIYYLDRDFKNAKNYYERAYNVEPSNSAALLAVARVNHDLENYRLAEQLYAQLKTRSPILAERYSYLEMRGEEAARASAVGRVKETVVWDE